MNFGATASVWNFNSGADALQQLLRGLLLATGHYVDDFNGLDDAILGGAAMVSGPLRGARLPDQEVQGAAPGEGARSPRGELQRFRRRSHTEPDGRQEGEDPSADSDGHRRGQPLPGRGGEASRPGLLLDTGGGQSSDQGHLCQGGRHGGLVGGLALDRPRGGSAIAG